MHILDRNWRGCAALFPAHAEGMTNFKRNPMNPIAALGLTPLDRVMIAKTPQEARMYGLWEDWGYFVGYEPNGSLCVANTIGNTNVYDWHQVESIEKREPIVVRALSKEGFCKKLGLRPHEVDNFVPEWHAATVIMASQHSRSGRIDGFQIRYVDGTEFGSAGKGIIHPDDYDRLLPLANRAYMPVNTSKRGRGAEARGQARLDERKAQKVIAKFLADALAGKKTRTDHDLKVVA